MSHSQQAPLATFIVDVESAEGVANPAGLLQVVSTFDRYRVPATWALSASRASRPLELLLGSLPAADLAVSLIHETPSSLQQRDWLVHELERRCELLHQVGKHPSAVLVESEQSVERLDFLVRHKVRWLVERNRRTPRSSEEPTGDLRQRSSRYGIWSVAPSWRIPERSRWSRQWQRITSRRRFSQATERARPVVAIVSVADLVGTRGAWSSFEEILKLAARRRNQGRLQIESLAGLTLMLQPPRKSKMRSILRAAA